MEGGLKRTRGLPDRLQKPWAPRRGPPGWRAAPPPPTSPDRAAGALLPPAVRPGAEGAGAPTATRAHI
eukprot:5386758-Pyramimonas_sp.AAC.1